MIRYRYLHSIHCIFHRVHRGNVVFSGNSQDLTEGPLPKQKKLRTNVASLWWTRILEKSSEFLVLNAFQEQYEAIWHFGWNLLWGRLQSLEKSSICSSSTFAAEISMQFFIVRVRLRDWATASMPVMNDMNGYEYDIDKCDCMFLCFPKISQFAPRNPGAWGDARTCLLQPFWGGKGKGEDEWKMVKDGRLEILGQSWKASWQFDVEICSFLQFFTFSCLWAVWILNHFSFGGVVWLRFAPFSTLPCAMLFNAGDCYARCLQQIWQGHHDSTAPVLNVATIRQSYNPASGNGEWVLRQTETETSQETAS